MANLPKKVRDLSLKEFASAQMTFFKELVAEEPDPDANIMPMIFYENQTAPEEAMNVDGVPQYGNPKIKDAVRQVMMQRLSDTGATRYAFGMIAWMKHIRVSKGTDPEKIFQEHKNKSLRNDPEKIEVINILAANIQGESVITVCKIIREDGKLRFEDMPEAGTEGKLAANLYFGPLLTLLSNQQPSKSAMN